MMKSGQDMCITLLLLLYPATLTREHCANYSHTVIKQTVEVGADDDTTTILFVYPRISTITPWSSKVTSIAEEVCRFEQVQRIERGTIMEITSKQELNTNLASRTLHDPVTQTLSQSIPDL